MRANERHVVHRDWVNNSLDRKFSIDNEKNRGDAPASTSIFDEVKRKYFIQ